MNIDLPNNPTMAYKQGWNDVVDMMLRQFSGIRDNFLDPIDSYQKASLEQANAVVHLIQEYKDIQAKLAEELDRMSK